MNYPFLLARAVQSMEASVCSDYKVFKKIWEDNPDYARELNLPTNDMMDKVLDELARTNVSTQVSRLVEAPKAS